jgi:hypothetical protein
MDLKRLLGGLSALVVIAGLLIFTLTFGGPLNRLPPQPPGWWTGDYVVDRTGIDLARPGPTVGLILLATGGTGLVLILCWQRRPGQRALTLKRVLTAYALYTLLLGGLFLCFGQGGLVNRRGWNYPHYEIRLDMPGPIVGWIFLGIGSVLLVLVWSLKPAPSGGRRPASAMPVALDAAALNPPQAPDLPRPDPGAPDFGIYARDPLKPPRE